MNFKPETHFANQKKTIKHTMILTLIILMSLPILGCGGNLSENPQEEIIGRWKSMDGSLNMEFTRDGKLHVVYIEIGFCREANSDLVFMNDGSLLGVWETPMRVWEMEISGKNMTLISEDGEEVQLIQFE